MKRIEGKSVYVDRYSDGTLRITIIENIDITNSAAPNTYENIEERFIPDVSIVSDNVPDVPSDDDNENENCLLASVSRTRNTIYDIVHNMDIEWFGTLTIAPEFHVDRNNKTELKKYVGDWFNNVRKRYAPDLQYIAIPEPHKKGGFHFHVLLGHVGKLNFIFSGVKQKQRKVYNLKQWVAGFSNFTEVTDFQRCANYVIKYITKDFLKDNIEFGKQRYLVSKNIPKKETLEKYFVPLDSNYNINSEDIGYDSKKFDLNLKRCEQIIKKYGNYDFSFSKILNLESGDFKFHSTRFFFKERK